MFTLAIEYDKKPVPANPRFDMSAGTELALPLKTIRVSRKDSGHHHTSRHIPAMHTSPGAKADGLTKSGQIVDSKKRICFIQINQILDICYDVHR